MARIANNAGPLWFPMIFTWYLLLCPPQTLFTHSSPLDVSRVQGDSGATATATVTATTSGGGGGDDGEQCSHDSIAKLIKTSPIILKGLGARIYTEDDFNSGSIATGIVTDGTELLRDVQAEQSSGQSTPRRAVDQKQTQTPRAATKRSILITLTPETIYRGASLLKLGPSPERESPSGGSGAGGGGGGGGGGSSDEAESSTSYEGQLNATLEPLSCFDGNVLKMLPTELIAFGKLVNMPQKQQQQQQQQHQQQQQQQIQQHDMDILRISINGLHRWSAKFENYIWKHLGWDDWSDFTLCSATCGKGVQQRFRRCLLDNPMVDLNMDMNRYASTDDDDDYAMASEDYERQLDDQATSDVFITTDDIEMHADIVHNEVRDSQAQAANVSTGKSIRDSHDNTIKGEQERAPSQRNSAGDQDKSKMQTERHKPVKGYATMYCEGYNIEQRDCNTFECSDDIIDLLRFYKQAPTPPVPPLSIDDAVPHAHAPSTQTNPSLSDAIDRIEIPTAPEVSTSSTAEIPVATAGMTAASVSSTMSTTSRPANLGHIKSWQNALNFTIMITSRSKNENKTTGTVFSIRNATQNLYLEAGGDGLRLYLERDNATEMLPVKFNLYDYRWHQVAISIQNGDFISIHVDCTWTNSFIVSKRLFGLPSDADIEIGRDFNGELQQLLVLPYNQERYQCSNKRTSINEVKRYIIDTFIDDYGN